MVLGFLSLAQLHQRAHVGMSSATALSAGLVLAVNKGKVVGLRNFVGYVVIGLGMLLGNYLYVNLIPQALFY